MTNSDKIRYFDTYIWVLRKHGARTLFDCYKEPSAYKRNVWDEGISLMHKLNGSHIAVLTYNIFMVTYGFFYKDDDGKIYFRVETPSASGILQLDVDQQHKLSEAL